MVQIINEIWKPVEENPVYYVSNCGNKMKFCKEMATLYNLKSPNTIFWIITGGNK